MGAAIFLLRLHAFMVGTWRRVYLYSSVNYDPKPHAQAKVRVQTCSSFKNPVLYQHAARVTVLALRTAY